MTDPTDTPETQETRMLDFIEPRGYRDRRESKRRYRLSLKAKA